MKVGKIIYIDKIVNEEELENKEKEFKLIEFASDFRPFYTLPEAILKLVQKGVKLIKLQSLSKPEIEIPIYWSTF